MKEFTVIVDSVSIENLYPNDQPFVYGSNYGPPIGVHKPRGVRITFTAQNGEVRSITCLFSEAMMSEPKELGL